MNNRQKQALKAEVRRIGIAAAIGAGLAAVYLHAPHAHADPFNSPEHQHDMAVMCTELAENPTFGGIQELINNWQKQEGTSNTAALMGTQTLIDAVTYDCQQYQPLIKAWIKTLPPVNPPRNNKVGTIA
jgi:hypothetical protein